MDREAAVIRSEMSQTRADLDRKLSRLEAKARELTPRRYLERLNATYFIDRAIGSILLLTGSVMAWRRYPRRARV